MTQHTSTWAAQSSGGVSLFLLSGATRTLVDAGSHACIVVSGPHSLSTCQMCGHATETVTGSVQ